MSARHGVPLFRAHHNKQGHFQHLKEIENPLD